MRHPLLAHSKYWAVVLPENIREREGGTDGEEGELIDEDEPDEHDSDESQEEGTCVIQNGSYLEVITVLYEDPDFAVVWKPPGMRVFILYLSFGA